MWCVKHRDGWCATKDGRLPPEGATNVETACDHFVVLPLGYARRLRPTCPECSQIPVTKTARALAAVRAGATTTIEIAAASGLTRQEASSTMNDLIIDGLVRRTGKKVPNPNPKGGPLVCYAPVSEKG